MRGYFGVAVYHPKRQVNIGSLFRTAQVLGADFMATIGRRYERQSSDTMKATRHVPLFEYASFDDFHEHLPLDCRLIGVEMYPQAQFIDDFSHPQRGVYLLGAEDYGLPDTVLARCHEIIRLRGTRSLNLAVAGSIVLYDRTRAKI